VLEEKVLKIDLNNMRISCKKKRKLIKSLIIKIYKKESLRKNKFYKQVQKQISFMKM
jgi:hypothetical protein